MEIYFQHDSEKDVVWVRVDQKVYGVCEKQARVWFKHNCDNVLSAALLCSHLNDTLEREVTKIRKRAYETGYSHGRAKKRKLKEFWSCISNSDDTIGY